MLWHREKHPPNKGIVWDDRTLGDLLEEYFFDIATEVRSLRSKQGELEFADLQRMGELEDLLADSPESLAGMSAEESDEVWETPHKTGDPLGDYWEWCISRGKDVDLDMKVEDIPENYKNA
jgi:hypothetical protein